MMEESGLVVVILIVTMSDEKCISFFNILISQLCNTLTGPVSLESVIKNKKEKKWVCEHVRERGKGIERKSKGARTETERDQVRESEKQGDKDREKNDKQGFFQMALPEYQTKNTVSNLMEKTSFCKSRNLQCFQDPL